MKRVSKQPFCQKGHLLTETKCNRITRVLCEHLEQLEDFGARLPQCYGRYVHLSLGTRLKCLSTRSMLVCDTGKHSVRKFPVGLIKYVIRSRTQSDA